MCLDLWVRRTPETDSPNPWGAIEHRLNYTIDNLINVSEKTEAARSRVEDADFALESARLAKAQVLQQAGTSMLGQANQMTQMVLDLLR